MLVQVRLEVFMITSGTIVEIVDNTGVKISRCIKALTKNNKACTGDLIIASLRKVKPRYAHKGQKKEQFKKGDIQIIFITQSNDYIFRATGEVVRTFKNQGILVGRKNIVNRALGTSYEKAIPYEVLVKAEKWKEVTKIAREIY
jgi:ribosomal protein L14